MVIVWLLKTKNGYDNAGGVVLETDRYEQLSTTWILITYIYI